MKRSSVHSISKLPKRSRNRAASQTRTIFQDRSIRSNPKTSLDLWNPTMGNCIKLKSRYTRAIPVESVTHNNRCSMLCS